MKRTVSMVRTGRAFGNRVARKEEKFSKEGKKFKRVEADTWEGPGSFDPDQEHYHPTGQYARHTWIEELR